jgi:ERF superfamily
VSRAQPNRRQTPVTEEELDRTFGDAAPLVAEVAKEADRNAEEEPNESESTQTYTGSGYSAINDWLRGKIAHALDTQPHGYLSTTPPPDFMAVASSLDGALARYQEDLPLILAAETAHVTGEAKDGRPIRYSYGYADLAGVSQVVLRAIGRYGLSFRALPTMTEQGFGLVYTLAHAASGQRETGFWPLPDPLRTGAQAVGSAITYARRYTLLAVTGTAVDKDDDDGAAASRPRENFDTASPVRPTPQVDPQTEAVFDHAARLKRAKLADLPGLWEEAKKHAKGAPGAVVADAFGARLAAIIEWPTTKDQYKTLTETLRQVGQDNLPWPHEGVSPVDRHRAVGVRIREQATEPPDPADEIEARIAGAKTSDELRAAGDALSIAVQQGLIARPRATELREFEAQRREALGRVPDAVAPPQPDPWDTLGPVPGTGDADNADALDEGEEWGHWSEDPDAPPPSDAYLELRADIRTLPDAKGAVPMMIDRIDQAFGTDAVTGDEHARLHELLSTRPPQESNWLNHWQWAAETADTEEELNGVTLAVNGDRQLPEPHVDEKQARILYAAVAARRNTIKMGTS